MNKEESRVVRNGDETKIHHEFVESRIHSYLASCIYLFIYIFPKLLKIPIDQFLSDKFMGYLQFPFVQVNHTKYQNVA